MEFPKRKLQRLKDYDYSKSGAYYITICTERRLPLFGKIANGAVLLNCAGKMIEEKLLNINCGAVSVVKYCIMPDHVHMILLISENGTTQGSFPTTIPQIVQRFKTATTKQYIDGVKAGKYLPFDKKIWQKSFYDHIIRNEQGFNEICRYIDENPMNWDFHF